MGRRSARPAAAASELPDRPVGRRLGRWAARDWGGKHHLSQGGRRLVGGGAGQAGPGMFAWRLGVLMGGVAAREVGLAPGGQAQAEPRRSLGMVVQRQQDPALQEVQGQDQDPRQRTDHALDTGAATRGSQAEGPRSPHPAWPFARLAGRRRRRPERAIKPRTLSRLMARSDRLSPSRSPLVRKKKGRRRNAATLGVRDSAGCRGISRRRATSARRARLRAVWSRPAKPGSRNDEGSMKRFPAGRRRYG